MICNKIDTTHFSFRISDELWNPDWLTYVPNTGGKAEYRDGTASTEDGSRWGVYDGALNCVGWIIPANGFLDLNGTDHTGYKMSFLLSAQRAYRALFEAK